MLIGIVSDTHDRLAGIYQAMAIFIDQNVSLVIHAGDVTTTETWNLWKAMADTERIPFVSVKGNNDRTVDADMIQLFIDNLTIAVYHGHHQRVVADLIDLQLFDVIITGHSHQSELKQIEKTKIVNPGSTAYGKTPTVALLDTVKQDVRFVPLKSPKG